MADFFIAVICITAFCKLIFYFRNLIIVRSYLSNVILPTVEIRNLREDCSMLILIPVIREQNIICQTLDHFMSMNVENINLYIAIAGTSRETNDNGTLSTGDVVNEWILRQDLSVGNIRDVFFCEAKELNGDRATQLNYAVLCFQEKYPSRKLDYIGVYDADSLPSVETLQQVRQIFTTNQSIVACQQPVHFIKAANRMAAEGKNPLLVASAIYQTTWTAIRELPSWIRYAQSPAEELFCENIYLIGHGEFLRFETYNMFKFPEFEVTDGIQLGYRLGMSNKKFSPLKEFCDDDVPQNIVGLINQHKRWFGGCMNLYGAYKWSYEHFGIKSIFQLVDGYWSQMCWAWASLSIIIALFVAIMTYDMTATVILGLIVVVYSYVIPLAAHLVLPGKITVRFSDWMVLPLAIALKGIGPNYFILEKIVCGNVKFKKVER